MKKAIGAVFLLAVLLLVLILASKAEFTYYVNGRGVIMPVQEWSLHGGFGGSLIHIFENHLDGTVTEYGVSEIQRGDIARYQFNEHLLRTGSVEKGDTLVWLFTSEIQLQIIQLEGELAYQQSLLAAYLSGKKPEEIMVAENRVELARQELETQRALTGRIMQLFKEDVVSQQEYELSLNDLKVKEYALEIAGSLFNTLTSGRKSEDIDAVRARISSLNNQIDQMKVHVDAFHLVTPISGKIIRERNPVIENTSEVILRIADFSSYAVIMPVDHAEEAYLQTGQLVIISSGSRKLSYTGELVAIDKTVRLMNNQPKIFLTILLSDTSNASFYRNMMVQGRIECDKPKAWEYAARKLKSVYQN